MRGYAGNPVFNLVFDLPSQAGYDPDHPEAEGRVGQSGVSVATVDDLATLFEGLPLDRTNASFIVGEPSIVVLAMYVVMAEERGYAPDVLRGNSMNYLLRGFSWDVVMFPPREALRVSVELIRYCVARMPRWNTTNLSGYIIREAGASAIQEVAFVLAKGWNLAEACVEAGIEPDAFLPRFGFQLAFHSDFFEEVAKIRALRRMWARGNRERFGARDPRALQARIHVHTAGSTLVAQQPLNNAIRAAVQSLGALLAETNSLQTSAYDEALAIPTEEAATLALRTQQILLHETGIPRVTDPLAGSYYVEWLTDRIEAEVTGLLDGIEARGGFLRAYAEGWLRQEIAREAARQRAAVERGEEVVVGVNAYPAGGLAAPAVFELDSAVEATAVARVRACRAGRDGARVAGALARVEAVAAAIRAGDRRELLMEALLDAARARATLGEAMDVLKRVFGYGYTS
jgi:methylmalonyl-CoA mutase N-terminal domain/subunit